MCVCVRVCRFCKTAIYIGLIKLISDLIPKMGKFSVLLGLSDSGDDEWPCVQFSPLKGFSTYRHSASSFRGTEGTAENIA